jgi:heme-degrading monooxygenase HmoA
VFVVLFEVEPRPERWADYLGIAKLLRPELERIDGFIDNARYRSTRSEGRLLSLSTWRDEKSLIRWRSHATHHDEGQQRGRFEIFADYRLRVAEVTADTHPPAGVEVRHSRLDETEIGAAKAVSVIEPKHGPLSDVDGGGLIEVERYDGLLEPHAPLLLASWRTLDAAVVPAGGRVRHARVIREYGIHDRREAPQYFPDVP